MPSVTRRSVDSACGMDDDRMWVFLAIWAILFLMAMGAGLGGKLDL